MSTSRPRSRALKPGAEALEGRQLLAATITGTDVDGDRWVLKLTGAGDLRVTAQPDAAGLAPEAGSPFLIDGITIGGANPLESRLIGQVRRGPGGDGKVYFSSIDELGGVALDGSGTNGIYAIDIPDFWLGQTSTEATAAPPSISIPDGVITLRFGGADVTFTPEGGTPLNQDNQNDTFTVNLGLPRTQGTSIIVDRVITNGQAATSATGQPTQNAVTFNVAGRINEFRANAILGDTQFPTSGFQGGGGTVVVSNSDPSGAITGQIGFARVGGNATNYSVMTNDKVSNFYVGGETNNVQLLAPNGSRAIGFGKGMDTVTILTHYIDSLQANRGALNSNVTVDRNVGRVLFGGDVVNTTFLSGVEQGLDTVFQTQSPPTNPLTQDGGAIKNVLIAGNLVNSVFAASVDPLGGQFGTDQDLIFPHANITAKVGGSIRNDDAVPDSPGRAFFAKIVRVTRGPVIPPIQPELPFKNFGAPPSGNRIVPGLQPTAGRRTNLLRQASPQARRLVFKGLNGPAAKR